MSEKHAAIYNEGWRDGYAAASAAVYRPAARVIQLHAAAALTLVVLAAVACIDRAAPPPPPPPRGESATWRAGDFRAGDKLTYHTGTCWLPRASEWQKTYIVNGATARFELRDGTWMFSR